MDGPLHSLQGLLTIMNANDQVCEAQISLEIDPKDTTRQEERAQLDLFRSISIGKMIAVIGSGVTTTYGYDSWGSMLRTLVNELKKMHEEDKIPIEKNEKEKLHFDKYGIRHASRLLANEAISNSDDYNLTIYGSLFPHLTKAGRKRIFKKYKRLFGPRWLVHRKSAKAAFPGITLPKASGDHLPQDFSHFLRVLAEFLDELEDPTGKQKKRTLTLRKEARRNDTSPDRIGSDRPLVDPLEKLRSSLRIRRFTTFNYDREIEYLLEDYDYPSNSLTSTGKADVAHAQSRLGSMARIISLSRKNASELIALAAIPSDDDETVVHLHGSVNRPEEMVVSQQEYDATYIDPHPQRNAFEDARKLMFGGNSVLYVGVGMQEEDVLRPLRYLASVVSERPIYALIPSLNSHEADISLKKRIKAAYRINVITYGPGSEHMPDVARKLGVTHPIEEPFKPLHEEAANIEAYLKEILLLASTDDDNSTSKTTDRNAKKSSPRLTRTKTPRIADGAPDYFTVLKQLPGFINSTNGPSSGRNAKSIESMRNGTNYANLERSIKNIATSVALNHAIEIMALAGRKWRQRWKIRHHEGTPPRNAAKISPLISTKEPRHTKDNKNYHTLVASRTSEPAGISSQPENSPHKQTRIEDLHSIHLHGHARADIRKSENLIRRLEERNQPIDVVRFKKGRGLTSFSSIARYQKINNRLNAAGAISFHVINLNHVISANPILPSIYKAIEESVNNSHSDQRKYFLINGTERLMNQDGSDVHNLASLYFLHSLQKKLNNKNDANAIIRVQDKVKVVFLLRRKQTEDRLLRILGLADVVPEDFARRAVASHIDQSSYSSIKWICAKYRWPNFVIRSI